MFKQLDDKLETHFVPANRKHDKIRQAVASGLRLARENSLRSTAAKGRPSEPSAPPSSATPPKP